MQARNRTLAMIANTNDGGLMAAGAVCPNDAMDNDKGVPKEQFKDHSNHGESANKISESHSEPPTRRSTPPPSPLSARLGDAAGGKIEVPPDGRDKKAKKFKRYSAQHDGASFSPVTASDRRFRPRSYQLWPFRRRRLETYRGR